METDERGVWQYRPAPPRPKRGFRPRPPSDDTARETRVAARHEYRGNSCPTCGVARALKTGACWC